MGDGNNLVIENTIKNSLWRAFTLANTDNNQVYNNNFISNTEKGFTSNGNNNIFNLDAPYGGNYYQNEQNGLYSTNNCQDNWIEDTFCSGGNGPMVFGSGSAAAYDYRPWITMNGMNFWLSQLLARRRRSHHGLPDARYGRPATALALRP